jgi:hypothetical protein
MGVQPDEPYTVEIAAVGDRIQASVNGRVLHDWTDSEPHGDGWIGMRTYDTDVTYDDWAVYGVE